MENQKSASGRIVFVTILLSVLYGVMRYHILGPVPWKDFPFYVLNKGISLAAFILLTLNFSLGPLKNLGIKVSEAWLNARKTLGMTGFLLVLIHSMIAFLLFKPTVYGKFFEENGTLTLLAGLSMLAGVISFVILWAYNLSFQTFLREDKAFIKFITSRRFLLIAMFFGVLHIFFMGYQGWTKPETWHGGMPPITLVAFTFWSGGYIINLLGRK